MKTFFITILLLFINSIGWSQHPLFEIPKDAPLDSLFQTIFRAYDFDKNAIRRGQKYGWYKKSEKIDADSFFVFAKDYCIERVGEQYFYDHFRCSVHSFKDDPYSETFTINFRFYPPHFEKEDYINIMFKSLDFLNIHQHAYPENLPDCRADSLQCDFPINRKRAIAIAEKEVIKGRDMKVVIGALTQDLKWSCRVTKNGWYGENFFIDARTGRVTNIKGWHRID